MTCHICQAEAVSRCYTCGELVCAEHAQGKTCARCTTAIVAGDPRGDRVSAEPIEKKAPPGWGRPKKAEKSVPPVCSSGRARARGVGENGPSRYCAEHAGPNGL